MEKKHIKSTVLFFIISLLFNGCNKPTQFSGTVFSKHNKPTPNVLLFIKCYEGNGGKQDNDIHLETDAAGAFLKTQTINRKVSYFSITAFSDSGGYIYTTSNVNDLKNMSIHLY